MFKTRNNYIQIQESHDIPELLNGLKINLNFIMVMNMMMLINVENL